MILPSIHEYPWETVVARDLLAEVERLQVELGGQLGAYLMVVDENTTLREEIGAVENVVNTYVENKGLPHDRVFRLGQRLEALETAIKTALKKLNWMLAPGQTRKEAVEILSEALANAQEDRANDA